MSGSDREAAGRPVSDTRFCPLILTARAAHSAAGERNWPK